MQNKSQIDIFQPELVFGNELKDGVNSVSQSIANALVSRSTFYQGDCLVEMDKIADKSIDMILCDLPYGTTQNKWDAVIPFDLLLMQYKRVLKDNGAIALTASQPFTSFLIVNWIGLYKYSWTWNKVNKFSGHLNAKKQPLRIVEDVCVFYTSQPTYNPIMVKGEPYTAISKGGKSSNFGSQIDKVKTVNEGLYFPKNLISIKGDKRGDEGRIHPTQKPIELMEYLIKTYTNEEETVLDNCMGSGTTGVACKKTGRHFIGIEKDEKYFEIAVNRINKI